MTNELLKHTASLLFMLFTILAYGQKNGTEQHSITVKGYIKPPAASKSFTLTLKTDNDTFNLSVDNTGYFSRTIKGIADDKHPGSAFIAYQEQHTQDLPAPVSIKRQFVLDTHIIALHLNTTQATITVEGGPENRIQDLFRETETVFSEKIKEKNLTPSGIQEISTEKYLQELAIIKKHNRSYVAFQKLKTMFRPTAYTIKDSIRDAILQLDTSRFSQAERDDIMKKFSDYVEKIRIKKDDSIFPDLITDGMSGQTTFKQLASQYPYLLIDIWATWCGPCIRQHPFINKLAADNSQNKSFAIAGVAISSKKTDWEKHLTEKPFRYENYWLDEKQGRLLVEKVILRGVPRYLLLRTADNIIIEKDIEIHDIEKTLIKHKLLQR
ncbi:TlpA family protein disulfide reductase [Chitinophaga sp. Mgbs1]|uniref:TlpA family protein disulfide reductase n=1 Tax=Chitinophaga solisilvae TaxID=1233460 RepID=A0A433WGH9_9BACT|nr:TlpA family protein disulfide reductase [Chitinophaga solisilvae]